MQDSSTVKAEFAIPHRSRSYLGSAQHRDGRRDVGRAEASASADTVDSLVISLSVPAANLIDFPYCLFTLSETPSSASMD